MNNSLIFSEESFELKIKLNVHGHNIHKASESAKNPFYIQILNQNPSSPNYCLLYDPLIGIKNYNILKYMTFPDSSSNYVHFCHI